VHVTFLINFWPQDHRGIGNKQLVQEQPKLGEKYGYKSVAEQHSIELGWGTLMEPQFNSFRDAICRDEEELSRFHQLVVRSVLATDIFDKEINDQRKQRWRVAFSSGNPSQSELNAEHVCNMKATIVIEHLIQASDVVRTLVILETQGMNSLNSSRRTQCNIGMSTENGMSVCFSKCTKLFA